MGYLGPIEPLSFHCQSAVIQAKEKIDPPVRVSPAHKKKTQLESWALEAAIEPIGYRSRSGGSG